MEKTWEVVNCFLCVLSEWKQSLWKLRSLGKEVYGKSKGHVRKIGNMLAICLGRGYQFLGNPQTQGSKEIGEDIVT